MGATRPVEQEEQQATLEEEVAAAVLALLIAGAGAAAIASTLALLLPPPILAIPQLAATISGDIAVMVLGAANLPGSGSQRRIGASGEELGYRAMYAVNAIKRVGTAALGENEGRLDRVRHALEVEGTYLAAHRQAQQRREAGRALNEAAAAIHGPVLSWVHLDTARTHRPAHVRAHGANFDIRNPPRETDGMLPGMAMHCDCVAGAPIKGARMLR